MIHIIGNRIKPGYSGILTLLMVVEGKYSPDRVLSERKALAVFEKGLTVFRFCCL